MCAELVDRKGLADRFDPAQRGQQRAQLILGNAEHLEVEVDGWLVQQAVADESADAQRAAAGLVNGGGHAARIVFEAHPQSI